MLRWGAARSLSWRIPCVRDGRRRYVTGIVEGAPARTRQHGKGKGQHLSRREQYQALPADWRAVIGVEVHAQLKSNKKLFSSAPSDDISASIHAAENSLVAPLDAALPGALPSLQMEPFTLALRACLALECQIAEWTSFDRKHYFYPDLTSGYQISQKYGEISPRSFISCYEETNVIFSAPLARNGALRLLQHDGFISDPSDEVTVKIEQVQLEQVSRISMSAV